MCKSDRKGEPLGALNSWTVDEPVTEVLKSLPLFGERIFTTQSSFESSPLGLMMSLSQSGFRVGETLVVRRQTIGRAFWGR